MGRNLAQKLISDHLISGEPLPGRELVIGIDQTLTQDATGTMTYLHFAAMGIPRIKTKLSVSYVDHNMLQTGFENADDHLFLQSAAAKFGSIFSRPGNGICHQAHLERFAIPGQTLLGADSHTTLVGAMGMLAIAAGGLEVAVAMAGGAYYLSMPRIVLVRLTGKLPPWVAAKDIILELLRRLTVSRGVGKVFEFGGPGVATLSVTQRATIANMGAELGATTTLFPSDEQTRRFLRAQQREEVWRPLSADPDADYDEVMELDLSSREPLIAQPSSPDNVCPVREIEGIRVDQVGVGSCNNSLYPDLATVAGILRGYKVPPGVSLVITPGSRQVLMMIARTGVLGDLIGAGARILEVACGPCIGMGQAPPSGGVSVRTYNRNFPGRSGTPNDRVYLASPHVAGAAALRGVITDPRRLGEPPRVREPRRYLRDDSMLVPPFPHPETVELRWGPNIKPLPSFPVLPEKLSGRVLLKVGDNITTDAILPAGTRVLPLRSNIPAISEFTFHPIDPHFPARAREWGGGLVVGGKNYGQGSSREHAAIAPKYLGVKVVLGKSFARIHLANLVNFGILPLTFEVEGDYEVMGQGDEWELLGVREGVRAGTGLRLRNLTKGREIPVKCQLSPRQREILLAGGLLNYIRQLAG